jgi:uncharacterized membrane protein YfcA
VTFIIATAVAFAVMIGALLQRVSGTGLALVSAPLLTLLLGPTTGVLVANVCSVCGAALMFTRVRRDVEWLRYRALALASIVGVVPGSLLVATVPEGWLALIVGISVLAALTVTLITRVEASKEHHRVPVLAAGFFAGLMSTTAGIAAPPVTIYAVYSRWLQQSFAATLQPFFFTVAALSLSTKISAGVGAQLDWRVGVYGALGLLVGVMIGGVLAGRINPTQARIVAVTLAYLGAAATVVHALIIL